MGCVASVRVRPSLKTSKPLTTTSELTPKIESQNISKIQDPIVVSSDINIHDRRPKRRLITRTRRRRPLFREEKITESFRVGLPVRMWPEAGDFNANRLSKSEDRKDFLVPEYPSKEFGRKTRKVFFEAIREDEGGEEMASLDTVPPLVAQHTRKAEPCVSRVITDPMINKEGKLGAGADDVNPDVTLTKGSPRLWTFDLAGNDAASKEGLKDSRTNGTSHRYFSKHNFDNQERGGGDIRLLKGQLCDCEESLVKIGVDE